MLDRLDLTIALLITLGLLGVVVPIVWASLADWERDVGRDD